MEMLCPQCMGELTKSDGKYVTCSLHGARYEVLFSRFQNRQVPKPLNQQDPARSGPSINPESPRTVLVKCPNCSAGYKIPAAHIGKSAVCKKCSQKFKLDVEKPAESVGSLMVLGRSSEAPPKKPNCARHPDVAAEYVCANCEAAMCKTCMFPKEDGTYLCPDCIIKENQSKTNPNLENIRKLWQESPDEYVKKAATEDIQGYEPSVARIIIDEAVKRGLVVTERQALPVSPVAPGQMCLWHPAVQAVQLCKICNSPVCQTCDFTLPGNIHICPRCATARPQGLSGKRRSYMIWSYILAAWSTLGAVFFMSGAAAAAMGPDIDTQAIGLLFMLVTLVPAIIGTALGSAAMQRNSKPISVWITFLWNGLIIVLFLLLSIVGLLSGV
jgi:hypothetical protein